MFTGRYEAIPEEGEKTTPSTWESMVDSFKSNYESPFRITPGIDPGARKDLSDSVKAMETAASAGEQGLGQKTANWFAGTAGMILNPYSLLAGEGAGALVGKAIPGGAGLLGKYLPASAEAATTALGKRTIGSFVGENVPNFVKNATVGGISKGGVTGYAMGTGFSLPEEIAKTYDPKNDNFNWWGGIKASSADGGIGVGLMAVPFLAGTILGKIFKRTGGEVDHSITAEKVAEALKNGDITSSEAEWYNHYLSRKLTNDQLNNHAVELLIKDGHPVDASTKKVLYQIFKPEEIDQLHTAVADSLASNLPENIKPLLKEFMVNNKVDELRGKSKMLDGLEGVVSFIRGKLDKRSQEEFNARGYIKSLFPNSVKGKNPFRQEKLFNALKAGKEIGITIPSQVSKRLRQHLKLKEFKSRINNYKKLFDRTKNKKYSELIKRTENKLEELTNNLQPLLSHNEELAHIRSRLIKDGKVRSDFKYTKGYERLLDLSRIENSPRIKNSAMSLLHEINVAHEYDMHEHYMHFLDSITKVMRASVGKLADHENVINYMKERLHKSAPDQTKIEKTELKAQAKVERAKEELVQDAAKKVEGQSSTPTAKKTFQDHFIAEYEEQMKDTPKEFRAEFDEAKNKFQEFNESQGVFKNLIKCVMGSLNV